MDELELSGDWEMIASYLNTIVAGRIFNDPDSAIQKATAAKDVMEVIQNAITFEKDTLLYFHAINDGIRDERARQVLRRYPGRNLTRIAAQRHHEEAVSCDFQRLWQLWN